MYINAEKKYSKLQSALESGAEATETRRAVQSLASSQLSSVGQRIKELTDHRTTQLQKVNDQDAKLPELRKAMNQAICNWQAITKVGDIAVNFEQVFGGIAQFAFFPTEGTMLAYKQAAMVLGQGGSIAGSMFSSDPAHEYILNQLRVVKDQAEDVDTSFSAPKDGSLQVSDAFNGKLFAATRRSFDEFCEKNWFPPAETAKKAMDKFVDGVQERNHSILQYKQTLTSLATTLANQTALKRLSDLTIAQQGGAAVQGLPESAVQASLTLTSAREQCRRLLYRDLRREVERRAKKTI